MRRAQADAGSKLIRNLFGYGSCENLTGAYQMVRTQLALNPRMVTGGYATGYQQQTLAPVTGVATQPDGITTAYRVSYVNGNVNPGILFTSGLEASMQYTVSVWVYQETVQAGGSILAIALKNQASSTNTVTSTTTWEKLTWTVTSGAGVTTGWDFGVRLQGTATGSGSFLVSAPLVEKSAVVGTWFAGDTAAVGDFTYAWTGTAHNSTSVQRGLVMGSWPSNPGSSNRWVVVSSTDWAASGTRSARVIATQATDGTVDATYAEIGLPNLTVGTRYRASVVMRLPVALAGTLASNSRQFVFPAPTPASVVQATTAPNAPGVWLHWVEFTATNTYHGIRMLNGAREGNGDLWLDNFMLTETGYTGDFIDGSKPFSKWDGTANASTSVGYPPQLLDIAGKPSIDLVGVGNTGGVAIPVAPYAARTIYLCYDSWGSTLNYPNYGYYGVSGTKGIVFQTAASGSLNLFPRLDFPGGDTNKGYSHSQARKSARHVVAISFNEGLTSASSLCDGNIPGLNTFALNPGTPGWDDGRAGVSSNAEGTGIRMLVFYAEHDTATKLALSRYLGNKYGALVA